jgi:hypothetical protein
VPAAPHRPTRISASSERNTAPATPPAFTSRSANAVGVLRHALAGIVALTVTLGVLTTAVLGPYYFVEAIVPASWDQGDAPALEDLLAGLVYLAFQLGLPVLVLLSSRRIFRWVYRGWTGGRGES